MHLCVTCLCVSLRLPSVTVLNGSVVTAAEREDAERFFIRFYQGYSEEELPYRSIPACTSALPSASPKPVTL